MLYNLASPARTAVSERGRSGPNDAGGRAAVAGVVPYCHWHDGDRPLSVLGVGCSRLGSIRNFTPVSEITRMLELALGHGINVIDTADIYGQGDSERIIGGVIRGRRDAAFVITKIGFSFGGGRRLVRRMKPLLRMAAKYSQAFSGGLGKTRDAAISQDFSTAHLTAALDGSLCRLGVDTVDGLLLHSPPLRVLRDARAAEFLDRARRQGKVRHFGASVDTLEEAVVAAGLDDFHLLQTNVEVARAFAAHRASADFAQRGGALFVRQILQPRSLAPDAPAPDIHDALPRALAIPHVTSAVVGLSSRVHFKAAIDAIT